MKLRLIIPVVALLAAVSLLFAEVDLTNAMCPIAKEQARSGLSVDYKGGKVYFCCAGCPEAFQKDPATYATAANHQLFVTGQATQKACPLTGGRVSPGLSAKVGGATVEFCCPSCKDAVEQAGEEGAIEKVFNDEAFDKAFAVTAAAAD